MNTQELPRLGGRRKTLTSSPLRAVSSAARRSPLGFAAGSFLLVLAVAAVLAPQLAPYDPLELHRQDRLADPNLKYWLGTDSFGRDQFSRLLYGSRVSLLVGTVPVLGSIAIGSCIGVFSAFTGGWRDSVIQRFMDCVMAFPTLITVLVMVSLLGPTLRNVVLVLMVVTIPTVNRVSRGLTLVTLQLSYIESARASGARDLRIILFHIVPNVVPAVAVLAASLTGGAILAEASLSFLGLGVPPPEPTWGNLLAGQNREVFEVAPILAITPGIAIALTVLAFNLLGDALRDNLDPRMRGTRSVGGAS
ncbi:MAG: ABC transporter permease [Dehalococcoidia bacterium]